jgi:hypothetical protein
MEQTPITKTANYRMTFSDFAVYADATQGQIRITLPETLLKGMLVFVQKVDDSNNPVIVECSERESIDGARSLLATKRWEGWTLVADGPETWKVLSRSFPSQTPN